MLNFLKIGMVCIGLLVSNAHAGTKVTAQSWLVSDANGKIIQSENANQQRSIASITKLMTAMVVLDSKQDLNETFKFKNMTVTRHELINLALVHSDNQAAQALCDHYNGGSPNCVRDMNYKAGRLGLTQTKYVDPTGLGVFNVSTAMELVTIVKTASTYPEIVTASKMSDVKIKIKRKWLVFRNTNPIIGKRHEFIVSKTGYISASGGCIVMMLNTDVGSRIVIVLGSKNTHTRIPEAEFISSLE